MSGILQRLSSAAADYKDPMREVPWSCADDTLPWLPDEMVSVTSLPLWQQLNAAERLQVSRVEFARLCAAGLWLEGLLINSVTRGGFVNTDCEETRIVLQEVREETGHGLMFLEMIERAGVSGVPLLGPTRLLTWIARLLDKDAAAFWAMVFIGESVTDTFALKALRASERNEQPICPTAQAVMQLHHRDEARHIAAAKVLLEKRIGAMGPMRRWVFRIVVRQLIGRFLEATLYPTEASLRALGIEEAASVRQQVLRSPVRRQLAQACAATALQLIADRLTAQSKPAAASS